jgi:hypothetical protein
MHTNIKNIDTINTNTHTKDTIHLINIDIKKFLEFQDGLRMTSGLIIHADLHKPNNKLVNA